MPAKLVTSTLVVFERSTLYFYLSTVLTPVILLVIEYYFSNVTVLVIKYKCSVLFPPLAYTLI